jgi:hypothetical protein
MGHPPPQSRTKRKCSRGGLSVIQEAQGATGDVPRHQQGPPTPRQPACRAKADSAKGPSQQKHLEPLRAAVRASCLPWVARTYKLGHDLR